MDWEALLVATALVASSTTALAAPGGTDTREIVEPQPHPSIVIDGNGDLEDPAAISGVRSGSGTAEDPYVISDWIIEYTRPSGIRLEDTTAHVVIEDVLLPGTGHLAASLPHCVSVPATGGCTQGAILLDGAENVTLRNVRGFRAGGTALDVEDAANVHVDGFELAADERSPDEGGSYYGLDVEGSHDVTVRNASFERSILPFFVENSENVHVERSAFGTDRIEERSARFYASSNVTIERSTFDQVQLTFKENPIANVSVRENVFENVTVAAAIESDFGVNVDGLTVCSNTFAPDEDGDAFHLGNASDVTVRGNSFEGFEVGLIAGTEGLVFERNLVDDPGETWDDWALTTPGAEVHNNRLESGELHLGANADATDNWWGHEDGPDVNFSQDGQAVEERDTPGSELRADERPFPTYDPWLEERPDVTVDCAPGQAVGPAEQEPVTVEGPAGLGPVPVAD